MTEMPKLLPEERQKLLTLLRRSDALGQAYDAVWDAEDRGSAEQKAETLWALGEMSAEAHEEFAAYRAELGIPDRPGRKNA
jgi:hypothetical protein